MSTNADKDLLFPSVSICQKWIPHEFDIVAMLALAKFTGRRHLRKRS
jgi:hypothetical protein